MLKTTIATAVLLISGTAAAGDFNFKYSERDFATPKAVKALHQRIQTSARSYCNKEYFSSKHLSEIKGCVSDISAQLVDNIDDRRLFAAVADNGRGNS